MRLLIDLQGCQNGSRERGIGRSSLALAKALLRQAGDHDIFVLLNALFPDTVKLLRRDLHGLVDPSRILMFHVPGPVDEFRPENAWRKHAAELLREKQISELDPDAVFVLSMVEGSLDNTVASVGWLGGRAIHAALLHDLIPLLDPDRYVGWPPARRWYMDKVASLRRCDLLLSVSASAKREAEGALGVDADRVVNISSGADTKFEQAQVDPDAIEACRNRLGIERPYLMHAGAVEPRKNFGGLVRAYAALAPELRARHQLVLVGRFSAEARQELQSLAQARGLRPRDVVLTGHVTDDELIALYAGCHLFVFPSLHEGFGLPVLEAMHFGVPVIASNTTSLPEVIGRADALFDPTSDSDIAARITRCLVDQDFHAELRRHSRQRAKMFSWDTSAKTALAALEHAVEARRGGASQVLSPAARDAVVFGHLVTPPEMPAPEVDDLERAAHCMALNTLEVERLRAHALNGGALRWRLEGPFDSSYSLAVVNRESARALEALGHTVVLHSTEGPGDFPANAGFLAANPDLAAMHARERDLGASRCDVVSRNLYPPRVADMTGPVNLLHQYAWEETGLPAAWVRDFNRHLSGMTVTSEHVRKVLIDNGVHVPIAVVGNGVDHWEQVVPARGLSFPGKRFRFLHVSSCFPRKGADVMLQAFGAAFSGSDDVSLLIKTFPNPHNEIHAMLADCRRAHPHYPDVHVIENDLTEQDLKALYLHCHVLVAPSRAEGFGLPLAEAMLCGLPVITTGWGGQLDFCSGENAWLVDYNFAPTQTHFGLTGSLWADPDPASLTRALRHARAATEAERQRRAEHGRNVLLGHYRWTDVTARAVAAARGWQSPIREAAAPPRIGWITTWNTRCGIASYARHVVQATGDAVAVLAPREDGLLAPDEPFVHRCWLSDKHDNAFDDLATTVRALALDVLVLQFNYAFFNFKGLAEFLHAQVDEGRVVVVTLHATADPPSAAQDEIWALRHAVPGLARCDRLLVHSLADLNRLKDMGLAHNAALFPHPLWDVAPSADASAMRRQGDPVVATFGYCLPHKGLPEMLRAAAELKRRGRSVRLLMLNAEYPAPISAELVARLRQDIVELGLQDDVELRSEYLSDAEIATRLAEADLIVYAYQHTLESASGAIRHGMATGRPLLVTPLPIFDEMGTAVFRCADITPSALADGIATVLDGLATDTADAHRVAEAAKRWRDDHHVEHLAARLTGMTRGLRRLRPASVTARTYLIDGSSRLLRAERGAQAHRALVADGLGGVLCFGPGVPMPSGHHEAVLLWEQPPQGGCDCEVVVRGVSQPIARLSLGSAPRTRHVSILFELQAPVAELAIRILVDEGFSGRLLSLTLRPTSDPAPAAHTGR